MLFASASDGSSLITVETAGDQPSLSLSHTHTHSLFVLMAFPLLQSLESTRRMMQLVEEVTTEPQHRYPDLPLASCDVGGCSRVGGARCH